jgi:predicted DNA-binding transcriptional regulator AlpA
MSTYLTTSEVALRLGVSRSTFERITRHLPGFPSPLRLSPRVIRWQWEAIEAWLEAQAGYSSRAISSALSA